MIKDFEGKVAVITGGAMGIGLGLAKAFANRGMKLVLADINKNALDKVSEELSDKNVEVLTVVTDVSVPEQVAHLAEVSYERFGHVNILCNNAGIGAGGPLRFLPKENWDWILGINLYGVIYGIQYFLDRMIKSGQPCHIINTSSLAGLTPGDSGPYSASKTAVIAISERLVLECFGTNVGVSVICPAQVRSKIVENADILSKEREDIWQETPSGSEFENAKKLIDKGMDPEVMAEMVIKALENDIFYIVTHPEFIPLIKSRFENIYEDTLKLHEGYEDKQTDKTKTFRNELPRFSVTYPDFFVELNPSPISKAIFTASYADINFEVNVSTISPKRRLEEVPKRIIRGLKILTKEIEMISDKSTTLKDRTPARETIFEYKVVGLFKSRGMHLSVIKDGKLIRIVISAAANNLTKNLKDIVYSLKFE